MCIQRVWVLFSHPYTSSHTESNDIDLDPESTPLAVIPVQRPSMLLAFESYGAGECMEVYLGVRGCTA